VKTYIIKRLLLMAVTLFGISLITFVIVQAAPGDPAQARAEGGGGKQQITKKVIEDTRKLYFLDKPILWNTAPDDKNTIQARLVGRLFDPNEEDVKDAQAELVEIGAIAAPALIARLEAATKDSEKERLVETLERVSPRDAAPRGSALEAQAAHWLAKKADLQARVEEAPARALAAKVLDGTLEAAGYEEGGAISLAGSALTPFLIAAAKDVDHPARDRAQLALSNVLRKAWSVPQTAESRTKLAERYEAMKASAAREDAPADLVAQAKLDRDAWIAAEQRSEAKEYAGRWTRFWRDEQDRYLTFEGFGATLRRFTQTRFARWFGMLLRGDFGESYRTKRPVVDMIIERLPVSMQLSLISVFIAYVIAIPLGIHSATRRGSRTDSVLTFGLFLLYSMPTFFVAEMLIIFTTGGDYPLIFPTGHLASDSAAEFPFGSSLLDRAWHLVLPITVLTYGSFAYISRQMRSSMLETIRQDYVRTARAKGLSEKTVIFKHALRNSLIPIITMLGSLLPHLLSGSVIIEQIFTINGMGKLGFESVIFRDYPVIMGISFFSALLTLLGIFVSDMLYALVDPRISYE